MTSFSDRLAARVSALQSPLCVGIDPHLSRLPATYRNRFGDHSRGGRERTAIAVGDWAVEVLEAVADVAAAIKPQVAFFEALYRRHPFRGESFAELVENTTHHQVAEVDRGDVPDWLHEALLRGMAVEPDDRWPDLATLLDGRRVVLKVVKPGVRDTLRRDTLLLRGLALLLQLVLPRYQPRRVVGEFCDYDIWFRLMCQTSCADDGYPVGGPCVDEAGQGAPRVGRRVDFVVVLEREGHRLEDRLLVVDHQDPRSGGVRHHHPKDLPAFFLSSAGT